MRVTAYFIGGPKHGDIDQLSEAHRRYRIPCVGEIPQQWTDYGHYSASATVRVGEYERGGELCGLKDSPSHNRPFIYLWQGAS